MSTSRDQLIANLQQTIADAQKQLEFLTDSDSFYELDLGSGNKTVFYIDFNSQVGITSTTSNNTSKLTTNWYNNYAGFLGSDTDTATTISTRLKNWLKLYNIHKFIYLTSNSATTYHVIRYDVGSDNFIPVSITLTEATASGEFVFRDSTECSQAITYMNDSDASDNDLRSLFNIS